MGFYGDLVDLPLQDILYVISSHGKSGLLVLTTQSHDISLEFDRGAVASVTTSDGSLKIGQLLVSQGYVTEEQIEQALGLQAVNPDTTRIGDVLIDVGYVTRGQIQNAVNAQLEASIFRILVQYGGTFSFEPATNIETDPIASGIRLESMVLNAMRLADEWGAVHDSNLRVELTDTLIDASTVNSLTDEERSLVMSVLNGDSTIDVIALRSGLNSEQFGQAVSGLQDRSMIQLVELKSTDQATADTP
ncbi:MAG: DUF4388 domain-containing protein [Sphaerobacteraceae bacterium]|nr:MAG: DUF4388 domain-containing protein [Sphaerobacteraceae bacterium]